MPDWYINKLTVSGNLVSTLAFQMAAADSSSVFSFNHLLPCPEWITDTQEISTWQRQNWGVFWGARDAFLEKENDFPVYAFETAWKPADYFTQRISAEFADLVFSLEYRPENGICQECITFINGLSTGAI